MMHDRMCLERAFERGDAPSVHELLVDLVLDKGHQHTRKHDPADNLQTQHQAPLDAHNK